MKRLTLLLGLLIACVTLSFAQDEKTQEAKQVEGPAIEFESKVLDYGIIEHQSNGKRKFMFTNVGTEPVVIKSAKGSCGCTVPKKPEEPIMPGEKGEIEVSYDTNRQGKFTKTVTLTTNTPDERIVLTIKGEVRKKEDMPAGVPASDKGAFGKSGN